MIIELKRLTKIFEKHKRKDKKIAVNNISLTLEPGVYGLLGANGAGKTTLLRMMCDILNPTEGKILYNNENIKKLGDSYRNILGYLPQQFGYYPEFTAYEYMDYIGAVKGLSKQDTMARSKELFDVVDLSDIAHKKISTFSGGMRQRLGIVQALLNNPKILLLDEPTAGLDPRERIKLRNYISETSKDRIVVISTHIVSDIQSIANKVIMMKRGNIICKDREDVLLKELEGYIWEVVIHEKDYFHYIKQYSVLNVLRDGSQIRLRIVADNVPVNAARLVSPNLEDLYLYYNPEETKENYNQEEIIV